MQAIPVPVWYRILIQLGSGFGVEPRLDIDPDQPHSLGVCEVFKKRKYDKMLSDNIMLPDNIFSDNII
jgi:hypothetical protein